MKNAYFPSLSNYRDLCRVMYEFTGNAYWIARPTFPKVNFFSEFYDVLSNVRALISAGEVCTFNLVFLDGTPAPFIINSLTIYPSKQS